MDYIPESIIRQKVKKSTPKKAVESSCFLNLRQRKMLLYLKEKKYTTVIEFSQITEVSVATARNDLKILQKHGFLKKMGKARNTEYHWQESKDTIDTKEV